MRQAAAQALHHCHYRSAFGARLTEQPLMQNVLADLALEAEAATWLGLRLAQAMDRASSVEAESELLRIGTAVGKYWNCKRVPGHAYEAMECIGGSGVMENSIMPRLYREAPVNAIWEGSGNVQCLDVLRAMGKTPETREVFVQEVEKGAGGDVRFGGFVDALKDDLRKAEFPAYRARALVERMALAWQASLLIRYAPAEVSDAFCASRLGDASGRVYGMLPAGIDCAAIVERARPRLETQG